MEDREFQCIDVRMSDQVPLFAAGDLSEEEAARFEAHLAACLSCAEREREMRSLLGAVRALVAERATATPPTPEVETPAKRPVARWVPVGIGAVLAAAGVVAAFFLSSGEPESVLRGRIHTLETRLARLEMQNDALAAAVASGPARADAAVQEIRERPFIYPPNL